MAKSATATEPKRAAKPEEPRELAQIEHMNATLAEAYDQLGYFAKIKIQKATLIRMANLEGMPLSGIDVIQTQQGPKIYINQEGREKYGIVKSGAETEQLKMEIRNKMQQWVDEKTRKPVVSNVYDGNDLFFGPNAKNTPDLYVGFHIGYRASWQSALGAVPEEMIEDNLKKWSGSHLFDPVLIPGVLFCNKKITKKNPSIYDLTPTIVKLIGYDEKKLKQCDFDGLPLF